jgi:hypothetical protein
MTEQLDKSLDIIESQYLQLLSFNGIMCSFYSDKISFNVLNAVAPTIFARIQMAIIEKIILGIAKLLDPSNQGRYRNITLNTLIDEIDSDKIELKHLLNEKIKSLKESSVEIVDLRNKIVAHSDYARAGETTIVYKGAAYDQVQEIISKISEFLGILRLGVGKDSTLYIGNGNGLELVNKLEDYCKIKGIIIEN